MPYRIADSRAENHPMPPIPSANLANAVIFAGLKVLALTSLMGKQPV